MNTLHTCLTSIFNAHPSRLPNRFYDGGMRHGIAIPSSEKDEMMNFLNTPRDDVEQQPPTWVEWATEADSDTESTVHVDDSESSSSGDEEEEEEYRPFMHLPPNPDGRRCRCGSTTHMTNNSFACPLNPRNVAAAAATTIARDDDAAANGDDDNSDEGDDDDAAANGDDDSDEGNDDDAAANGDDDGDDNPPNMESSSPPSRPLRPRRRLGMPTRRRRSSLGDTRPQGPSRRRPRIQAEIDVGTKVKSSGTRWQLPATTMYYGEVVKKSTFRGAIRYEVKWQDGVVEYLREEHMGPLLC